jgi:hypothetical protein
LFNRIAEQLGQPTAVVLRELCKEEILVGVHANFGVMQLRRNRLAAAWVAALAV